MKIIKREAEKIQKEDAHGGSGSRKVFVDKNHIKSSHFEAMTHGFLPAGKSYDWHEHDNTEEIMVVLKGAGKVSDKDGDYEYKTGDVFIFPTNTQHKIHNPTNDENEMIFVRIKL